MHDRVKKLLPFVFIVFTLLVGYYVFKNREYINLSKINFKEKITSEEDALEEPITQESEVTQFETSEDGPNEELQEIYESEDLLVANDIKQSDVKERSRSLQNSTEAVVYDIDTNEKKGTAYKSKDEDHTYLYAIVELPQISVQDDGASYGTWLLSDNSDIVRKAGSLRPVAEGKYELVFLGGDAPEDFTKLIITKESNFEDDVMETRILEANFLNL